MDVSPQNEHADQDSAVVSPAQLFERTIVGLLVLLASSARTTLLMLCRPGKFARLLRSESVVIAPPYSFLLLSLLTAGISVRSAIEFYERRVDQTLLSRLAATAESITLENIFVLTVPCIVLVAMVGAGLAGLVRPGVFFAWHPVVRAVCCTAALQFMLVTAGCLVLLVLKISYGAAAVTSESEFDLLVFAAIAGLVIVSAVPLWHVIRLEGQTLWGRNVVSVTILSGLCSATLLLGVSVANAVSFDLNSTIADVRQRYHREILGDVTLAVRTLNSRVLQDETNRAVVEMTLAIVNVSHEPLLVPRPFSLRNALDDRLAPIEVLASSTDLADQPGWMIEPGQTQLVRWMLDLPDWCADIRHQQAPLPVRFACYPLRGTEDLLNQHPVGEASVVLAELNWPLSDAWRAQDHATIRRLTQALSGQRIQ